jgi:CRISPR system Cascade subunit CasA
LRRHSLAELLIGLLTVSLSPADEDEWAKRYHTPPAVEDLEAILAPFANALVLDGDGPRFFQDLDALEGEPVPISGLLIDAPGANTLRDNADHFVKRGGVEALSRAGAAIVLATLQTMAPSGGAGHRTSLRGGGPLATLVVPGTSEGQEASLWQRLWVNVPIDMRAPPNDAARIFPWLAPTRVSDNAGQATTPEHVISLQAFFGMPRRIRLVFEPNTKGTACDLLGHADDVIVRSYVTRPWGTNYVGWDRQHRLSPYYRPRPNDPTFLPMHLQSSRVGYRDWLSMTLGGDGESRLPAACVDQFKRYGTVLFYPDKESRYRSRLLAAGYAMDNAKPLDFGEALLPLIFAGTPSGNERLSEIAQGLITAAQEAAGQLNSSVKRGVLGARSKAAVDSALLRPVRDRFWAETESGFYDLLRNAVRTVDVDNAEWMDRKEDVRAEFGERWRKHLQHQALAIFDDTVPIDSAEVDRLADIVEARKYLVLALTGYGTTGKKLFKGLGLPLPKPKKGDDK